MDNTSKLKKHSGINNQDHIKLLLLLLSLSGRAQPLTLKWKHFTFHFCLNHDQSTGH